MSLRLQSDQFILLESATWCHIIGSQSFMVVGFLGTGCVVIFAAVHMLTNVHILTKSASSTKTGSLQLYQLWSIFGPRARGVTCLR